MARAIALTAVFALGGCLGGAEKDDTGILPGDLTTGGITDGGKAFPRQIITVAATPNQRRELVWDPGTANERQLTDDKFKRYVQIPTDAKPGIHNISINIPGRPVRTMQINVLKTPAMSFPNPRIEDVAITNFSVTGVAHEAEVCTETTLEMIDSIRNGSDSLDLKFGRKYEDQIGQYSPETRTVCRTEPVAAFLNATIFITVTNADADADIIIRPAGEQNQIEITQTDLFSALPSREIHSRKPETYGYPVFHAVQFRIDVEGLQSGTEYDIRVTNNPKRNDPDDGGRKYRSNQLAFTVPSSPDRVDSDNDRLSDVVEERLRAEGLPADPMHKTIFVEADFLNTAIPDEDIWPIAKRAFSNAPILNPDGSPGISLFVDHGQDRGGSGPFNRGGAIPVGLPFLGLDSCDWISPVIPICATLRELKKTHFDPGRREIFHYAVFGSLSPGGSGGQGIIGGWDFIVTSWRDAAWNGEDGIDAKAAVFVHELGHNLTLEHSGRPSINNGDGNQFQSPWTPNTPSIMSYRWQMDGIDRDCDFKPDRVITFSQGMYKDFDEAKLSERDGVCDNRPADINGDDKIAEDPPTSANEFWACEVTDNGCDKDTDDIHRDGNQWGAVAFRPLEPLCTVGEPNCRSWFEERK